MRLIQLILTILGCIVYKYIAQAFLGYSHDDLSSFIDNKLLPNYEKIEFICYEHLDWQALTNYYRHPLYTIYRTHNCEFDK